MNLVLRLLRKSTGKMYVLTCITDCMPVLLRVLWMIDDT